MTPETRYAKSGEVSIAYQIVGDGPRDLILVPGWMSNIEVFWDEPAVARFLRRLASFSRLILFDKRGTGLSDCLDTLSDLETRMDDVRAVMDAVGSERAALCGYSEGGVMCALFAATYPARTTALITIGSYARQKPGPGYPWGRTQEQQEKLLDAIQKDWGGPVGLDLRAPSFAHDDRVRQWWARYLRMSASPTTALALTRMNYDIDVRHILGAIHVPTLVLHSVGDMAVDVHCSRHLAESIEGAKYVEFPGRDHLPWGADADAILDEIEEFLTGSRHGPEPDRILASILFTDIVGSTDRAAELGLEVRTGLHTGECELIDDNVGGIAVHTTSRIAALARPGEVLVSHTVKDLVAGSGIRFESRGTHTLKGVPGEWPLFATIP